jgi:surface antigen
MRGRVDGAVRLKRRAGLDANPLRRRSDWVEAWIRLGLLAVFLIAGPLAAIAAGRWADDSAVSAARAQAATEYRERAVLLGHAPAGSSYPFADGSGPVLVQARWTAPNGTSHVGAVPAAAGARVGSAVTVWTTASGALAAAPTAHAQIVSRVVFFVTVTSAALAALLLTGWGAALRVLGRRRIAAWEAAWAAVEPQWTRRLH